MHMGRGKNNLEREHADPDKIILQVGILNKHPFNDNNNSDAL